MESIFILNNPIIIRTHTILVFTNIRWILNKKTLPQYIQCIRKVNILKKTVLRRVRKFPLHV